MASYLMNCNFFKVNFPKATDQHFDKVLTDIMTGRPEPQQRDFEKNGDIIRLAVWEKKDQHSYYSGLLIRMCNNSTLRKAFVNSDDVAFVDLLNNERICEIMCFAYFEETGTLAIHRNRKAGSPYWIEDYITDKCGLEFQLEAIMDSKAWDRLDKMGVIKKFNVVMSIPENIGAIDSSEESVGSMVELVNSYKGRRLTVEISAGRKREGLKSTVRDLMRRVKKIGGNVTVEKLQARGSDDDGTHVLDLIDEHIKGSEQISTKNAQIEESDIWNALYNAYYKVRQEIINQSNS